MAREQVVVEPNSVIVYFTDGTVVSVHNGGDHLVTVNRDDARDTETIKH